MARDFIINGETMVWVTFGLQILANPNPIPDVPPQTYELGLASGQVKINFRYSHEEIKVDDFGSTIPADIMSNLMDATISMDLIHYDPYVLDTCIGQSHGGQGLVGQENPYVNYNTVGYMSPAGTLLGAGGDILTETEVYGMYLWLRSPQLGLPWRFLYTCLTESPTIITLGTEKSIAQCKWRAIPLAIPNVNTGEVVSNNAILWDRG